MKYHNITHDDMLNGEGLRVVLWVSGCSHHCKNCQNPITWNPDYGKEFGDDEIAEIIEGLNHDYISGLTLSGGDPLNHYVTPDILKLVILIRNKFGDSKSIWIYTGYTIDYILQNLNNPLFKEKLEIIKKCDVLVDGKFIEELADTKYKWAGSTNQRIIDIKKSMAIDFISVVPYNPKFE